MSFEELALVNTGEGSIDADNFNFRVGSVEVRAEIDGTTFYCTGFDQVFNLGSLAVANISIAVGVAAGPRVTDLGQVDQIDKSQFSPIKKFAPVKILVTVNEVDVGGGGDEARLGQALATGEFVAFEGIIDAVFFKKTANSIDLTIQCVSKNIDLGSGLTATNINVKTSDIESVSRPITAFGSNPDFPDTSSLSSEIWGSYIKPLIDFFAGTKAIKQRSTAYQKLIAATAQAGLSAALDRVESFLNMKYLERPSSFKLKLSTGLPEVVAAGASDISGLKLMGEVSKYIFSVLIDVGGKVYLIPDWAYGTRAQCVSIPSGGYYSSNFQTKSTLSVYGSSVVGTGVTIGSSQNFSREHNKTVPSLLGSYVYPSNDAPELASATIIAAPDYFSEGLFARDSDKNPEMNVQLTTMMSPDRAVNDDKIQEGMSADTGQPDSELVEQYARWATLEALFSNNRIDITTPLRHDIVPGMMMRVNVSRFREEATTEENAFYGRVYSCRVQIDAANGKASSSFSLDRLRDNDDQSIIEGDDQGPFLFEPSFDDIKQLDLWSTGGNE